MKKWLKLLLTVVVVVLVLLLLAIGVIIYSAFNTISKTDTDFSNYEMYRSELHYAEDFLPPQSELMSADNLHFAYQENSMAIFISKTIAVTVQYSPAEYEVAKQNIAAEYVFLDAPIPYHSEGAYELDNAFSYRGYDFQVVPYLDCRYFGMIGINDDTYSIAYLYYSDTDRDFIADAGQDLDQAMCSLIDDECCMEPFTE